MFKVVVLTRNEEHDLPRCLAALQGWANILVVDSGSSDATQDLARAAGVEVAVHPFQSFGAQRNWALNYLGATVSWVLFLDADEVATPEFRAAIDQAISRAADDVAGYYCCWKLVLFERWLRRSDAFPKWQLRLVRVGRADFTDFGHGQKEGTVSGRLDYIHEPYVHYAFSKGWTAWVERHNRYSSLEAQARRDVRPNWSRVFTTNSSQRNQALKPLVSSFAVWPMVRFLVDYGLRGGFLEGKAGFVYCFQMAYYEFLIQLKMNELASPDDA